MTALLKQLIQIGMPENNGFGGSLTDEQMAQWLFTYAQERKADKARYDFFRAEVAALRGWKESAASLLSQWDEVWIALGRPGELGASKAEESLKAVVSLLAFRAEVAATLAEALAAIEAIPASDYSTDGDAAELVRRDDAADIVRAAMAKLGIGETR